MVFRFPGVLAISICISECNGIARRPTELQAGVDPPKHWARHHVGVVGSGHGTLATETISWGDSSPHAVGLLRADPNSSMNLTAKTTAGAVRQVFLGTQAMRRNVMFGSFFAVAVVGFELMHRWASGVDLDSEMPGLQDVQTERSHGTGPLRGAMRLWGAYLAEDTGYACACISLILCLITFSQYTNKLLVEWVSNFWDTIEVWAADDNRDNAVAALNALLLEFLFFAFMHLFSGIYLSYVTTMFEVRVRASITYKITNRWLSGFAYYHLMVPGVASVGAGNPDQRIQEDVDLFVGQSVGLTTGFVSNIIQLCLFSKLLYDMSPEYVMGIPGLRCQGWLLWVCWIYAAVATRLVHLVAHPLEPLTYYNQRVEADFRWELGSVRRYGEEIAMGGGEEIIQDRARYRFELIRRCIWERMTVQKHFDAVLGFFNQAETIFSFIFLGPPFLHHQITLGVVMSGQRAMNLVVGSSMWFASRYSTIVSWRASTGRLVRFGEAVEEQLRKSKAYVAKMDDVAPSECVSCKDLTIWMPKATDGTLENLEEGAEPAKVLLLDKLDFAVLRGQKVLLCGPSGTGKTCLLRALVGAWPFAEGRVAVQGGKAKTLCFSSQVFMPSGTLRAVIAYPTLARQVIDDDVESALRAVGLEFLLQQGLDQEEDWTKVLSDGQKARVSFARLIIHKPMFPAMDEPLAHLDNTSQMQVLNAVMAALPAESGLLVVHHAPTPEVRACFDLRYELDVERKTIGPVD